MWWNTRFVSWVGVGATDISGSCVIVFCHCGPKCLSIDNYQKLKEKYMIILFLYRDTHILAYPHKVTRNFPPDGAVGKVCSDSHEAEKHCLQTRKKGELTPPAGCTDRAKKVKAKVILGVYFRFLSMYTSCRILKPEA